MRNSSRNATRSWRAMARNNSNSRSFEQPAPVLELRCCPVGNMAVLVTVRIADEYQKHRHPVQSVRSWVRHPSDLSLPGAARTYLKYRCADGLGRTALEPPRECRNPLALAHFVVEQALGRVIGID